MSDVTNSDQNNSNLQGDDIKQTGSIGTGGSLTDISSNKTHLGEFLSPAANLNTPSPKNLNNVFTSSPKKAFNFSIVATMLGLVLLLTGVISGIFLIQHPQIFLQRAADEKEEKEVNTYASCNDIKVYNNNWKLLAQEQLKNLKTGDEIYLTIKCSATSGVFDVARFTINGQTTDNISTQRPETNEFYYLYKIPRGIESFSIKAEVHHSELGWL